MCEEIPDVHEHCDEPADQDRDEVAYQTSDHCSEEGAVELVASGVREETIFIGSPAVNAERVGADENKENGNDGAYAPEAPSEILIDSGAPTVQRDDRATGVAHGHLPLQRMSLNYEV